MIKKNLLLFILIFVFTFSTVFARSRGVSEYGTANTIFSIFLVILISLLLFISIEDFKYQKISSRLLIISLILAIGLIITPVISEVNTIEVLKNYDFSASESIRSCLLITIFPALLSTSSNTVSKADVVVISIMGIVLGSNYLILGIYITTVIAAVYAIVQIVRLKDYRKIKVPLITFATAGIVLALLFGEYFTFLKI